MEDYKERIIKLESKSDELCSKIMELWKAVFGNGKPGLKYDIIKMKNAVHYNNIITSILTVALIGNLVKYFIG